MLQNPSKKDPPKRGDIYRRLKGYASDTAAMRTVNLNETAVLPMYGAESARYNTLWKLVDIGASNVTLRRVGGWFTHITLSSGDLDMYFEKATINFKMKNLARGIFTIGVLLLGVAATEVFLTFSRLSMQLNASVLVAAWLVLVVLLARLWTD